ncbi:MAG: argininosuccinate lyase [Polyangiaceae bacterium]|nr:argininosuccinate lyase [Polyangiaceae bacterium]
MMRYTARDDFRLDQRLLAYDLKATAAHVRGLGRIGVLNADEVQKLTAALGDLAVENAEGRFLLTERDEDGHTAIEMRLQDRLGDVGKKVHTGRSRNDQVLVAMRLYERDAIDEIATHAIVGARALLDLAEREARTAMPGYTHLQRAVPSTVGYWAAAIAEGLEGSLFSLAAARSLVDQSPLGGAAGFGVNLPLDRDGVSKDLGFARVAVNPLASQSSRGIVEAMVLSACFHAMAVVRRFAWDISLFTMSEMGFVKLDDALTTGSSIMPQKRNPDVIELMRAACSVVVGALNEVQTIVALPSGYHRDLQLTKGPTMRGLDETIATVSLVPRVLKGMTLDRARLAAAVTPECFATDKAVDLAVAGVPFREAYKKVAAEISGLAQGDPLASIDARTSFGSPGNLGLDELARRISELEKSFAVA